MPSISINGTELYYEKRGSGQPVVFIHADVSNSSMWDSQVEFFAKDYQVVRYDRRGYGQSQPITGEFSHLEDLKALVDRLNLDSVYLVGSSAGGTTAVDFVLAYPERVKALVIQGATPGGYEMQGPPPVEIIKMQEALQTGDMDTALEYGARIWVDGLQGRTPEQVNPELRQRVKETLKTTFQNFMAGPEKPAAIRAIDHLHEIRIPTLILMGSEEHPGIVEVGRLMVEKLPDARMEIIENAGHLPSMEQPEAFNQRVAAFFASV